MAVDTISENLIAKEDALKRRLRDYGAIAVAYSGGVDSAYLAAMAHEALGDKAHMVLADSPSIPRFEVAQALALAKARGWRLTLIGTQEFDNEEYLKNDGRRCYFCKSELFTKMDAFAKGHGLRVLAYGENADDGLDPTRLGAKAAREHRVVAPLAELGFRKDDIRALSKHHGLPTWDKPSFACLSSRFPVGDRVDVKAMSQVEQAEDALRLLGFRQYRARHHGDLCRIEIDPADFAKVLDGETRRAIIDALTRAGYRHATLDLAGYRTGSTAGR
ncbi:MAG TPA: ATP-dependent sacrificial sulfur transferase LarE [Candidatus Hydrogenedentes bacterium]|nr:ATP-dependent sacrificial sulfur transferase LarE [Candidatus Hydrogenedentota bacterium]